MDDPGWTPLSKSGMNRATVNQNLGLLLQIRMEIDSWKMNCLEICFRWKGRGLPKSKLEPRGVEPLTSTMRMLRSTKLNYGPEFFGKSCDSLRSLRIFLHYLRCDLFSRKGSWVPFGRASHRSHFFVATDRWFRLSKDIASRSYAILPQCHRTVPSWLAKTDIQALHRGWVFLRAIAWGVVL